MTYEEPKRSEGPVPHQYLSCAAQESAESTQRGTERLIGNYNLVKMELYQAASLMTASQKKILNEVIRLGATVTMVGVALGEGQFKHGTVECRVSTSHPMHDSAYLTITPRGGIWGIVFPHPWAEDRNEVKVRSRRELAKQYVRMGLYKRGPKKQ